MSVFSAIFGTHSSRELKRIEPLADAVEALEEEYRGLSDFDLKAKTAGFKARLADGETLDDILPEAFATVREAADRVIGLRPYRVQIVGGIVLFQGRIAEMKTGEGKTLVAVFPAYLAALEGKGVHIVTVNDYLAHRDSEWMGKIHRFLGLTVGLIVHEKENPERRDAYNADITYGTNNEMGFDYLRDNMALYKSEMVTRGRHFAIVDEVDSILIDEARTPLIISGKGDDSTHLYKTTNELVRRMKKTVVKQLDDKEEHEDIEGDYIVDEKAKTATLTQAGIEKAEKFFKVDNITDPEHTTFLHHVNQAIRAHGVMKHDVDYVVKDGEVIIVDEFTGRLMNGRRYSDGLHQAIEAKEGVKVEHESKTLATITFQNFFRLYEKLSGMTGTAQTEAEEFQTIYKLDIIEIPTNKPVMRQDHNDAVYKNVKGKTQAIVSQIKECHLRGQPVLVGTTSIEGSESLSAALKREGIKHNVLNAKHHEQEAYIIAQAGRPAAVTIATNMAGRGTDIMLGGNPEYLARLDLKKLNLSEEIPEEAERLEKLFEEKFKHYKAECLHDAEKVRDAGGLFILGTERHESRRIDNQLRGRAGRQGDPGASKFYLSMEDDLMRLFGSSRLQSVLETLRMPDDEPIDQKMLSGAIENAQKRVESRNFQTRKHVLQYDDVMNKQREIIYGERLSVLNGGDVSESISKMIASRIEKAKSEVFGDKHYVESLEQAKRFEESMREYFLREPVFNEKNVTQTTSPEDLAALLKEYAAEVYAKREQDLGSDIMRELERVVLLRAVDQHWMDHIDAMHELRQGIGLRAYAQTDPVKAYTSEGFEMFDAMTDMIRDDTVKMIYNLRVNTGEPKRQAVAKVTGASASDGSETPKKAPKRVVMKIGVNDPCPCGSGLKYKKCTCEQYHKS